MEGPLVGAVAEVVGRHVGGDDISCEGPALEGGCFDKAAATRLKIVAISVIFLTSLLGFYIPLSGQRFRFLNSKGKPFLMTKVFASGVILATAFIHMLPTAQNVFASSCLPENPWRKFPWGGFIAMLGALGTLVVDFAATTFNMERLKHHPLKSEKERIDDMTDPKEALCESHVDDLNDSMFAHARHVVVAQVFEFGVAAHSIIVGITVGVSNIPCTIKPLFAALTFHQFFEGVALGGCVAQAEFRNATIAFMGLGFAITTSLGIAIGMGIAASYNENSPTSLIVKGTFDAISAGILTYMALVDLIAVDFFGKQMQRSKRLQVNAFAFLLLGVGAMSIIGLWA